MQVEFRHVLQDTSRLEENVKRGLMSLSAFTTIKKREASRLSLAQMRAAR